MIIFLDWMAVVMFMFTLLSYFFAPENYNISLISGVIFLCTARIVEAIEVRRRK